jgi:hypothetical protein
MEFEPTPAYLQYLFGSSANDEEVKGQLRVVISNAKLLPRASYGYDEFLKICEELIKLGGHARVVGLTGITQARLSKISRGFAGVHSI